MRTIPNCSLPLVFLAVFLFFNFETNAQTEYTTIQKNINPDAKHLFHDLTKAGDSLILKSNTIFYKITFLNKDDKIQKKFNPPLREAKIALHDVTVGDYSVLVYQKDRIVVFHIVRNLEIETASIEPVIEDSHITTSIAENEIKNYEDVAVDNQTKTLTTSDEKVPKRYNISNVNRHGTQSRESFRKAHLRPNGKPYK